MKEMKNLSVLFHANQLNKITVVTYLNGYLRKRHRNQSWLIFFKSENY